MRTDSLVTYDITKTYDWNYAHAPEIPPVLAVPACPGRWDFCGLRVSAPIGIAAGPLLNSRWITYYALLGFDVVTYKTVRSSARASYGLPNLLPVGGDPLSNSETTVIADQDAVDYDSWAISFGMPSKDPAVWREDVRVARRRLDPSHVLVVSIVASPREGWTLDDIVSDFVQCAQWARDAGASAIEANLSCPNVGTPEASLYLSEDASRAVAMSIRDTAPALPIILKIGVFEGRDQARRFVRAVSGHATALSTTNTLSAVVKTRDGHTAFDGARRGIGGRTIAHRCLAELRLLRGVIQEVDADLRLISVGGVTCATDVLERLEAGAHHVQLATAAMLNPLAGVEIRRDLARLAVA